MEKALKNNRLEETLIFLLNNGKEIGIDNLSKFQIMKLIFLLEVEAYKYTGKSFINAISFVREKNGPISIEIYRALDNLLDKGCIALNVTKKADYPYPRNCYSLKKMPNKMHLRNTEKIFLNSVFNSYINLPQNKLKQIAYGAEPMKEILVKEKKEDKILKGHRLDFNKIPLDEELVDIISNENG